jgi:hypothetical protein
MDCAGWDGHTSRCRLIATAVRFLQSRPYRMAQRKCTPIIGAFAVKSQLSYYTSHGHPFLLVNARSSRLTVPFYSVLSAFFNWQAGISNPSANALCFQFSRLKRECFQSSRELLNTMFLAPLSMPGFSA